MAKKKDLNKLFDYTLSGLVFTPSSKTSNTISSHKILSFNDWSDPKFNDFKKEFKKFFVSRQGFRCAICRYKIQADGDYEDIDHIIAKSQKEQWLFAFKNLVCTCTPCNRRKGTENTFNNAFNRKRIFPDDENAFLVFNPHYDKWSDHLQIEDGIFIVGKPNSKGFATIQTYKLYRYQICINLSNEQEYPDYKKDAIKVFKRLYRPAGLSNKEVKQLSTAKKRFEELIPS